MTLGFSIMTATGFSANQAGLNVEDRLLPKMAVITTASGQYGIPLLQLSSGVGDNDLKVDRGTVGLDQFTKLKKLNFRA
jgi:hypothetical protein